MWAVVPENNQGDVVPLDQLKQFACAGNGTSSISVRWTNWPISGEMGLHGDGITGKKHRAGLRQEKEQNYTESIPTIISMLSV